MSAQQHCPGVQAAGIINIKPFTKAFGHALHKASSTTVEACTHV